MVGIDTVVDTLWGESPRSTADRMCRRSPDSEYEKASADRGGRQVPKLEDRRAAEVPGFDRREQRPLYPATTQPPSTWIT